MKASDFQKAWGKNNGTSSNRNNHSNRHSIYMLDCCNDLKLGESERY